MKVIAGPRGSGRTAQLISWALSAPGRYIACSTQAEFRLLKQRIDADWGMSGRRAERWLIGPGQGPIPMGEQGVYGIDNYDSMPNVSYMIARLSPLVLGAIVVRVDGIVVPNFNTVHDDFASIIKEL